MKQIRILTGGKSCLLVFSI